MPTILLLGRAGMNHVFENARSQLAKLQNLTIHTGTNIEHVRSVFSTASAEKTSIDHVFIGAGIELDKRLEIVKEIFEQSKTTSVHLKEASTGPEGFVPFVEAILNGMS